MQQRRLRLGDILDDYCPRERRITNHAVVAMIDEDVKQTRCTTCDADHEYKHGRVPLPRRKKSAGVLFDDAPEGNEPRPVLTTAAPAFDHVSAADDSHEDDDAPVAEDTQGEDLGAEDLDAEEMQAAPAPDEEPEEIHAAAGAEDEGPVHRRLIRATLPRPEGQAPERKEPDFTIRHQGGRGYEQGRNGHRPHGGHRPARQAQGQGGAPSRFGGGQRHGGGQRSGQGGGQGGPHGQRQAQGNRAGRPGGQNRGPRPGGAGRKRGR